MDRVHMIDYLNKKILFIDFSDLKSFNEIKDVTIKAQEYIHSQPSSSVYTLTTVEGTHFNSEIREMFTVYMKGNKPFVKASAVIGVSGLKQIMYNTLMKLTGRDTRSFSSLDQAKTWLVGQN
jgi:hypothetical protein